VTRPSKVGEIILIIFGLFFAAAGFFFASAFLFSAPGRVQGNPWVGVLISTIFILIGGGIVYAAVYGTRKLREQAAAEQSNPDCPWLWRKDWAARRAESNNRNGVFGLWIAAIFANGIAFTVAAAVVPKLWRTSAPTVFFPLVFCVIGVALAVAAIRASIRRRRFGKTYFEFASLPFCPGQSLKGTIHLRFNTDARHGIDLSLSCVRRIEVGAGKDRSVHETVLWQANNNVSQQFLVPGPMGDATIPVEFSIPSDAYESNHDQVNDQVLWLLHAQADVPGVNYSDDFEVPVFRLTASPSSASLSTASFLSSGEVESGIAAPAFQSDASDVSAPANPKVVVSTAMNGGTEFYFPPFRNPGLVLGLFLFTTVWTGIVYFLLHSHAPWFFAPVFGLFDILLIYALVQATMGSFRIEVGNGKIVFRRALLGMGRAQEIPFSDIARILTSTTAQQKGTRPYYAVRLYTKEGRKQTLADAIGDRQEARWVCAQLEKFAGLKLDTHVAADPGLGNYGPPPQRGQAPSGSLPTFRRNSPVAIAIGLAFFFAWTGFLGYNIFSRRHTQPKPIPKGAAPARTRLRQVAYSPLSDMDVQRLRTLPEQAQAEELLDRAIQHDPRALDLFEQNIGSYRNLTRTARMNQLEQRSLYSTDLRVRYANADLNLAIDGLPKTEDTAEQLIAQAQTDPEHRPYSVYHMGMLAGRSVGYDRIYPILLDYAKNDANPQVRQWAVEGMRYLGTDEALQELFDSFTHDPSDAVRDRAGCNVSDCGNFKRKQRMRMVPRLIELAADPKTTPQMRSWSFMALREITDQTLPADGSAWQNWYAQHGAEKLAEFEQSDWWKVRGDQ
jgi:hypothetical protein